MNCLRLRVECSFGPADSPSRSVRPGDASPAVGSAGNHDAPQTSLGWRPIVDIEGELHQATPLPAHEQRFDFASSTTSKSYAPPSGLPAQIPTALFDIFDLELLHHFFTHVSQTLAEDGTSPIKWREQLPSTVFSSPVSLHALLGVSALHLARNDKHRRLQCLERADQHHELTLRPLIYELNHLGNENANGIFVAASFLCYYHFSLGPQPGQYLVFSEQGAGKLIWLLRGIKAILKKVSPFSEARPVNPNEVSVPELSPGSRNTSQHLRPARLQYHEPLSRLRSFVSVLEAEEQTMVKYSTALERLTACFENANNMALSPDDIQARIRAVMKWLYGLEDGYLQALQKKRPVALVILAHFAVLLHEVRQMWCMEGWGTHVMHGVKLHLDTRYADWILWPAQTLEMTP